VHISNELQLYYQYRKVATLCIDGRDDGSLPLTINQPSGYLSLAILLLVLIRKACLLERNQRLDIGKYRTLTATFELGIKVVADTIDLELSIFIVDSTGIWRPAISSPYLMIMDKRASNVQCLVR